MVGVLVGVCEGIAVAVGVLVGIEVGVFVEVEINVAVVVGGTVVHVGGMVDVFTGLGKNIVEVASSCCEVNGGTTVDGEDASASVSPGFIQFITGPTIAAQAAITVAIPPMIATSTSVFIPNLGFSGFRATTGFGNSSVTCIALPEETTLLIAE